MDLAAVIWPSPMRLVISEKERGIESRTSLQLIGFFLDETAGKGVFHGPDEARPVADGADFKGLFTPRCSSHDKASHDHYNGCNVCSTDCLFPEDTDGGSHSPRKGQVCGAGKAAARSH